MNPLVMFYDTTGKFDLIPLLDTIMDIMVRVDNVPTNIASLHWINVIPKKRKGYIRKFTPNFLSVLMETIFQMVLNPILTFFRPIAFFWKCKDQSLWKICVLFNENIIYIRMSWAISKQNITITYGRVTDCNSYMLWSRRTTEY